MLINDNKSTPYNSSIANEFGQWRYFNSALKKLGEAKPIAPNIVAKPTTVDDNEVDWMGALGAAAEGIMGYFDLKKQQGIETANKYLQTHSLEEYRDEMRNGAIPFQDDPFAMQSLASEYGKVYFNAVNQAFADKVAAGEYKELKPEQVDAAFFEFANENLQGAAKDFGFSEDASFFKQGFYENSKAARIKAMMDNVVVRDADLRAKATVQRNAKITALCNSEEGTVESKSQAILDVFAECRTTEDVGESFKHLQGALAESPNGSEIIDYLKDKVLEPYGVKISDMIDPASLDTIRIKSLNVRDSMNSAQWMDFVTQVDGLVNNGDVRQVEAMLKLEVANGGGSKTQRYTYLLGAVSRAQSQADRINKETAKQYEADMLSRRYAQRVQAQLDGQDVENWNTAKPQYKGLGTDAQVAIVRTMANTAFQSGDSRKVVKVLELASTPTADGDVWKKACKEIVDETLADVESDISYARDDGTGMVPPDRTTTLENGDKIPTSMFKLATLYSVNPTAISRMVGDNTTKATKYQYVARLVNEGRGRDAVRYLSSVDSLKEDYKNENRGIPLHIDPKVAFNPNITDSTGVMYQQAVYAEATRFRELNPEWKTEKCVEEAVKNIKASHTEVGDLLLPTGTLLSAFSGLDPRLKNDIDIDGLASSAIKKVSELKTKELGITEAQFSDKYNAPIYNMADDSLVYISKDDYKHFKVSLRDLSRFMYDDFFTQSKTPTTISGQLRKFNRNVTIGEGDH